MYELVMSVDARRSGEYEDPAKADMRRHLYEVLDASFAEAGVRPGGFHREDRGDGILAAVPARVPPARLLGVWLTELYQQLRHSNRGLRRPLGLRVGMHVGPVLHDGNGVSGRAVDLACRLADSAAARSALDAARADLVCVVSDPLYGDVVGPGGRFIEPEAYAAVRLELKEGPVTAWIQVPGRSPAVWSPAVGNGGGGARHGAGGTGPTPPAPPAADPAPAPDPVALGARDGGAPGTRAPAGDTAAGREEDGGTGSSPAVRVEGDQSVNVGNRYLGPVHIGRTVHAPHTGGREPGGE